jgi:Spy/CpxP family protein refolding chaperone
LALAALALASGPALAQHAGHGSPSAYAGEEAREVKSLSAEDIAELQRGGGWGLAKAAELNGLPGPAHVLEMKAELALSEAQAAAVRAIFDGMRAAAVDEGRRLIEGEAALEAAFRAREVTDEGLRGLLAGIEASRARLRHIHLSAHLETPAVLTPAQVARYNELRGHAAPCAAAPPGHDPANWRRHNGCE